MSDALVVFPPCSVLRSCDSGSYFPSCLEKATSDWEKERETGEPGHFLTKMLALINRILDWFRSLFWKEEMELTLVGLQYSGKTTFVNVIAVSL